MVYKLKEIPRASPVIRPKFSFSGASRSPSFRFSEQPRFRIGEDMGNMDMDDKKHIIIAVVVCVIIAIIYAYKYKPEKVMDNSDPMKPVVSTKLLFMYGILPAILVGVILGYVYDNYIEQD